MNDFLVSFLLGIVLVTSGIALVLMLGFAFARTLSSANSRGFRSRH